MAFCHFHGIAVNNSGLVNKKTSNQLLNNNKHIDTPFHFAVQNLPQSETITPSYQK